MNELLLILTLIFVFTTILITYYKLGKYGLIALSAILPIIANIEVTVLVTAFGITQALGNMIFAGSYVISDILAENEGKKYAKKSVYAGVVGLLFFFPLTFIWQFYSADNVELFNHFKEIFSNTPRIVIASITAYFISDRLDVKLYFKFWKFTKKIFKDDKKGLWIRNNASTLISQLINNTCFTLIAFYGVYDLSTLLSIGASAYIIFIFTSLLDTPVVYIARKIKRRTKQEVGAM